MKTTDFIKEGYIADDADSMHKDHEVQMARQDCYNSAKNAIELHHLLKQVNEMQGLEGWVSEKLALAADYLKTVKEYLEYDLMSKQEAMPVFNMESASAQFDELLSEDTCAGGVAAVVAPLGGSVPTAKSSKKKTTYKNSPVIKRTEIGKGIY